MSHVAHTRAAASRWAEAKRLRAEIDRLRAEYQRLMDEALRYEQEIPPFPAS